MFPSFTSPPRPKNMAPTQQRLLYARGILLLRRVGDRSGVSSFSRSLADLARPLLLLVWQSSSTMPADKHLYITHVRFHLRHDRGVLLRAGADGHVLVVLGGATKHATKRDEKRGRSQSRCQKKDAG